MTDDLTILTSSYRISGWQSVRLTRGVERCPSDLSISMTERYPGELGSVFLNPGLPIQAMLGEDVVLTGYVDQFSPSFSAHSHQIGLTARGACADLVDCCPEWPSGQMSNINALQIAQKLGAPYGIKAHMSPDGEDPGTVLPQDNVILTASAYSVIEEKCRWAELLAYEDTDGNLILSRVGKKKAASGIVEGENVETAMVTYSQHNRFSNYEIVRMGIDVFDDVGHGGNLVAEIKDEGVQRHRLKRIVADNMPGLGNDYAEKRGRWEASRRYGRSAQVRATVDNWRDSSGALWEPNTLADIHLPSLHAKDLTWLISEVTYRMDGQGTHADLVLMPPEAFNPAPFVYPGYWDLPPGAQAR